jgi:hypothetical protein
MLRYDEELKGLNRRTNGHIEVWDHLGMGRLNCYTIDLCYMQLIERIL